MILVVGSANMDLVFQVERFPQPGETLLGGPFSTFPGGKGANQAVAVGRLGGQVALCGCVGFDLFGDELMDSLRHSGVDTTYTWQSSDVETGTAAILVGADAQNMIVVAPGANELLDGAHVEDSIRASGADIVLAQLEVPDAAIEAASRARRFILNPAPARTIPEGVLGNTWLLVPNETETHALTGILPVNEQACRRAAHELLGMGPRQVVITLGERGLFWTDGDHALDLPAFPVKPVDTTAAGDAFCGALAHFLAAEMPMVEALRWASAAAALSTTRPGAQQSMPSLDEVAALVQA